MAVVRLHIDIDRDVYPELFATLMALGQPSLRDERLRQLAAMGLAWEAVRIHGPAVTQLPAKSAARKPASRPEVVERPQLPVLVDIVATSPGDTAPAQPSDADDGPVPPVEPMPVSAASRGSGHRARLKRMKDRGLFKNG